MSADDIDLSLLNRKELSEETIEDRMIDTQISADVVNIMNQLPKLQREVLDMRFFRDMSFKDIAKATNVSINTALGRMRYAILNMRRIAKEKNITLSR